jgi:glycosyltransferase involved in cell wall biosynthesis
MESLKLVKLIVRGYKTYSSRHYSCSRTEASARVPISKWKIVKTLQPHSPFYPVSQVGLITFIYYKLIDNLFSSVIRKYNIIAITPIEQEIIMRKFKILSTLIPNGVNDVYFEQKTEDKGCLLYIGRISKEKNLLTLLKAYKISWMKYVNLSRCRRRNI